MISLLTWWMKLNTADGMQIQKVQGWLQGRQQNAILLLEFFDGFQRIAAIC